MSKDGKENECDSAIPTYSFNRYGALPMGCNIHHNAVLIYFSWFLLVMYFYRIKSKTPTQFVYLVLNLFLP